MTGNLLEVLKKASGESYQEITTKTKKNHKYIRWAGGDFDIYFNKGINFNNLTDFFKNYNYDVISEGDDTYIYVKSTSTNDFVNTEFCVTDEKYNKWLQDFEETCKERNEEEETWKIELENMKKFDIEHMMKARTETESKYVALIALYILKENGDVLVYDCFNDVYLDSEKLQALFQV